MNTITKKQFKSYIGNFDFTNLFNQLGWNFADEHFPVKLKDDIYSFQLVAEKGGFRIIVFRPAENQDLPDYSTRLQLDRKIAKLYREHLIIFCDRNSSTQIWQLFVRQTGKPSRLSQTRWHKGQEPELLYQKTANLFFTLDEEENITISDVVDRVNENFRKNVEQVTKKFYENFRREHRKFIDFIKGISVIADKEWYASLMLNRLMFCYFIQKKGFLDKNLNYLKEKLETCQQKKGKDRFYVSFYRNFLLTLFHHGLGSPEHSEELKKEIGKIPYLNGGLFDIHDLEKEYAGIDIGDEAFSTVFQFFDQYNWHLDTRFAASGKDVNPDVIGYIFEKFINDRAKMGAYYTKEDITDYISKNCIIPYLFDETVRNYPKAFKKDSELWNMLKESGDAYIYEAVRKGADLPLPEEIAAGIDTEKPNLLERRKEWNKPAPAEFALPTEIWREVVDRRKRYNEVKSRIEKGEIQSINDFITYNMNIRQFSQDVTDNTSDPVFLRHFYNALKNISILDPTCGSGAFLFAAMNILEPLYESCVQRMENFVEESPKGKYKFFEEVLAQVKSPEHPNLKYFIYKSIILRNLYGVDIMKEAVEIAKLRLFLKLVATVDADYRKENLGLEPLPDIDFNIRAGNTLVGFATEAELDKALTCTIDGLLAKPAMMEKMEMVSMAFHNFKAIQLEEKEFRSGNQDVKNPVQDMKQAKDELSKRLKELNCELNQLLHRQTSEMEYKSWLQSHQPFHWFAEFYEIIQDKGGFDVIIGNPPYVEYTKIPYKINGYSSIKCGNLYTFVIERCIQFSKHDRKIGMIVPISSICTDRMIEYQKIISENETWNSLFAERPSKLFTGAEVQLVISIINLKNQPITYSSSYFKWGADFREHLFSNINYAEITSFKRKGSFPKIGTKNELSILKKILKDKKCINNYLEKSASIFVSYRNAGGRYYKVVLNYEPDFKVNGIQKPSSTYQKLRIVNKEIADTICAVMNSTIFFWYWTVFSDTWHMVNREIGNYPIEINEYLIKNLPKINKNLIADLQRNSNNRIESRNKGLDKIEFTQFNVRESKPIIDEIDKVLAKHYGFTDEELDFIINYDIKYRMGKELENDDTSV
ncbi:MAG: DNA methyltransferase [Desulfococcaceae bacterium]